MSDRTCSIEGCEKKHLARGWCGTHYKRWQTHGDPGVVLAGGGRPPAGSESPHWVGDDASYWTVHGRLRVVRGHASAHRCVQCGDQGKEWAYTHSDPDVRYSHLGAPYSTNLDLYAPMCVPCHKLFDLAHNGVISDGR